MSHATEPARIAVAGRPQRARTSALIIVVYAAAVYLFFLAVLGYAAGFVAGFGVPEGIDQGGAPRCQSRWPSTCSCCCCSRFSTP